MSVFETREYFASFLQQNREKKLCDFFSLDERFAGIRRHAAVNDSESQIIRFPPVFYLGYTDQESRDKYFRLCKNYP